MKSTTRTSINTNAAVTLALLAAASSSASGYQLRTTLTEDHRFETQFEAWRNLHSKVYESAEEYSSRKEIFADNVALITAHNMKNLSWTMGTNQFSDLTNE